MKRITELAHEAVRAVVTPGTTVVDATVGNGHDTLFLATLVGPHGRVIGFDLQEAAILSARRRLAEAGVEHAELHCDDHATIGAVIGEQVCAVMFNLGYLPGGDHAVTTETGSTVEALRQARTILSPGGMISVVCYRGHPGGESESQAVEDWARERECDGDAVEVAGKERTEAGPFLVTVRSPSGVKL